MLCRLGLGAGLRVAFEANVRVGFVLSASRVSWHRGSLFRLGHPLPRRRHK